jgi:hypothetical protein
VALISGVEMALNSTTLFIIFLIFLVAIASYQAHKSKNYTYCMFLRRDRSWKNKWVKAKAGRIEFDGGWYYFNPKRTFSKILDEGFPYMIFPTKVDAVILRWDKPNALNPEDFSNDWETPEARKNMNKTEDIEALAKGNRQSLGKPQKKGMLEGYMPIIMILGVVALGYMMYMLMGKIDMLGQAINVLQSMMAR